MATQRDVRNRIASVRNIQTITRAMEMVAAARLRRAEQRIQALRPYADAIRRMARESAQAAGEMPRLPVLSEHASVEHQALLLIAGDRGLAGAFNSQIVRAGVAVAHASERESVSTRFYSAGRRPTSSLTFRGLEPKESFTGFSDRPSFADARRIAQRVMSAYVDEEVDRVDVIYNGYVSPVSQVVRRETLLPLQRAQIFDVDGNPLAAPAQAATASAPQAQGQPVHAISVDYEPDAEEILRRLVPDYVEISIFRALLESTASEHGARMTAMRNASDNANTLIEDLTLEMNRARQAAITQEITEIVGGAEGQFQG
jgi:F-type H+-transporting ATPase subunit gamma